jgi:hypothetical protein
MGWERLCRIRYTVSGVYGRGMLPELYIIPVDMIIKTCIRNYSVIRKN